MEPLKNRIIDRKTIIRGDLASCYRGRDARLDRTIFLKVLNPSFTADKEICARFEREAKAAARLDHPNLVHIHEFGEDPEEGLYMILEWVTGQSLRDYIKLGKRLTDSELIELAGQILSGLEELHRAGIIHRDVKPENILIGEDGRIRITDFSLAALQGSVKLTHHQAIVGTPAYMSPEQAAGRPTDIRSDLYSVGIVLLELASGANPFEAGDLLESLRRIRELNPKVRETLGEEYSDALKDLIVSCLEKNPENRIASAEDALAMIGKQDRRTKRQGNTSKSTRPLIYAAGFILLAALLVFSLQRGWFKSEPIVALNDTLQLEIPKDTFSTVIETSEDSLKKETEQAQFAGIPEEKTPATIEPQEQPNQGVIPAPRPGTEDTPLRPHDFETIVPDSIEIMITTEPWAHVSVGGRQVGTTPLKAPLKLPLGENEFTFQNSAFPLIWTKLMLSDSMLRVHFQLTDFVSTMQFSVIPWGEIYIDDEHRGTSPLSTPVFLLPGTHKLLVTHPELSSLSDMVKVAAGDTIRITVDLNKSKLAVLSSQDPGQ